MLNIEQLSQSLAEFNCVAVREQGFEMLKYLSGSSDRIICGDRGAFSKGPVRPSHFSFWVHDAGDVAFVGLWNGLLYFLWDGDQLGQLCRYFCATHGGRTESPLTSINPSVLSDSGLLPVELLHIVGSNAPTWQEVKSFSAISDATFERMLLHIEANVDTIEFIEGGRIVIRLGGALCITNRPITPAVDFITFVFRDGLRETDDQVRLLRIVHASSDLNLFDGGWGNQISLEDSYYDMPHGRRPDSPSNWCD